MRRESLQKSRQFVFFKQEYAQTLVVGQVTRVLFSERQLHPVTQTEGKGRHDVRCHALCIQMLHLDTHTRHRGRGAHKCLKLCGLVFRSTANDRMHVHTALYTNNTYCFFSRARKF